MAANESSKYQPVSEPDGRTDEDTPQDELEDESADNTPDDAFRIVFRFLGKIERVLLQHPDEENETGESPRAHEALPPLHYFGRTFLGRLM